MSCFGRWTLLLLASLIVAGCTPREHHDWEDPTVFAIIKQAPHATLFPYESVEAALVDDQAQSPYFRFLEHN